LLQNNSLCEGKNTQLNKAGSRWICYKHAIQKRNKLHHSNAWGESLQYRYYR